MQLQKLLSNNVLNFSFRKFQTIQGFHYLTQTNIERNIIPLLINRRNKCCCQCQKKGKKVTTRNCLKKRFSKKDSHSANKVTIVGVGPVGATCAFSLLTQNVTKRICLIDAFPKKMKGEAMDMQHGSVFLGNPRITTSKDLKASRGSRVCVITAGAPRKKVEDRLKFAGKNAAVMKKIIPGLVKHSPKAIFVIVSNPVDIMTFVASKLSKLPKNRVLGTGCVLDSARFRYYMGKRLGVAPSSVHGYVIGEHGNSSVPVWSQVNVAGTRLKVINKYIGKEDDPEKWYKVHQDVVDSAMKVIKAKGYSNWAVGLATATIVKAILQNTNQVFSVSIPVVGQYGNAKCTYLSLPVTLNSNGIGHVVNLNLSTDEICLFRKSASTVYGVQSKLGI